MLGSFYFSFSWTFPNSFKDVRNFSDDFRTLSEGFQRFSENLINYKTPEKIVLIHFISFLKISEHFLRFFEKFKKIIKTLEKWFWNVFEVFRKISENIKKDF